MSRRRNPFAALTAAAAAVLMVGGIAACSSGGGTSAASSNSPIVVCGDFALAGPYAQIGETDNWGAQSPTSSTSTPHGGILGHQVTYVTLNNQSNAAQSELIASKCVQSVPRAVHHRP